MALGTRHRAQQAWRSDAAGEADEGIASPAIAEAAARGGAEDVVLDQST